MRYEVVIVGAGPAGLSAALLLGRCRRRVLVVDADEPRNRDAHALHGFLTRDGIAPLELRALGRAELRRYDSVELCVGRVEHARRAADGDFELNLAGGASARARKLILATGVVDELPEVPGVRERYGKSVFHCPYCDGWELRDQPLAVYGRGEAGARFALGLTQWSRDLVLCSDGPAEVPAATRALLERHGVAVREQRLARLEGHGDTLERIVFDAGEPLARRALFFKTAVHLRSPLALELGCKPNAHGVVHTGWHERTEVPGLYVCGDASHDVELAIIAAAEGTQAAFDINRALMDEALA